MAGKAGMHLVIDQKQLKDLVNLIKNQKEIKNPIKTEKTPSKTLERLPSGVANSASRENPPITILGQNIGRAQTSIKRQS